MTHQQDAVLGLSFAGLLAYAIGRVVHRRRETHDEPTPVEIEP